MSKLLLALALSSVLTSIASGKLQCVNTPKTITATADFLFLLDYSGSMCSKIQGVQSGFNRFVARIGQSGVQARYGLVVYGGVPKILVGFTEDAATVNTKIGEVQCNGGGQEATFEAIRGVLPPNNFAGFTSTCFNCQVPGAKTWRDGAQKVLIVATDEDSDFPTLARYRMPGQTSGVTNAGMNYAWPSLASLGNKFEPSVGPSFIRPSSVAQFNSNATTTAYRYRTGLEGSGLEPSYAQEVYETAKAIVDNKVYVNLLYSLYGNGQQTWDSSNPWWTVAKNSITNSTLRNQFPSDSRVIMSMQFGDHRLASQTSNFTLYDPIKTYQNFVKARLDSSVWGYVLSAQTQGYNGVMRAFDINTFANSRDPKSAAIINAFYNQIVLTTTYLQLNCFDVVDPNDPSTDQIFQDARNKNDGITRAYVPATSVIYNGPVETDSTDSVEEGANGGAVAPNNYVPPVPTFVRDQDAAPAALTNGPAAAAATGSLSTVGAAAGAAALIGAAMGAMVLRKRRLQAKIFQDLMFDNANVGVINPLYTEHGFKENPLFDTNTESA